SHSPNVGILLPELPHKTSSIESSTNFITLAVSVATRPYSSAVFAPICQGPSISFPRHQVLIANGSSAPFSLRRSLQYVPPGWFEYSTKLRAASAPLVPRLTAILTSVPAWLAQSINS